MRNLLTVSFFLLICSSASAQSFTSARCGTSDVRRPRKDIRALTQTEISAYIAAVRAQMTRPTTNSPSAYDRHVNVHINFQSTIHGYPNFFPWHRIYLKHFELLIQKTCRTCTIPYWDWAADSQAPERSIIFGSAYFGGNGSGSSLCVTTGQFQTWRPFYPNSHCLTRRFNSGSRITAFHSTEVVNADISRSSTYNALRNAIEYGSHAVVHNGIGSDFARMVSPNDPLFWCHHAMVDRIWDLWQWRVTDWTNYSGTNADGSSARLTNVLRPFVETVQQAMDVWDYCYYYEDFSPTGSSTLQRRQLRKKPKKSKVNAKNTTQLKSTDLKDIFIKKSRVDAVTYVAPNDRQSLVKLRTPQALPADWLRINNLNVQEARKREAEYAQIYASINAIPNYVSPCALVAHPEALKGITKEESTLKAHVNDVDVELNLNGRTGDDAVNFVYKTVNYASKSATPGTTSDPKLQLKKIIGEPHLGTSSPSDERKAPKPRPRG